MDYSLEIYINRIEYQYKLFVELTITKHREWALSACKQSYYLPLVLFRSTVAHTCHFKTSQYAIHKTTKFNIFHLFDFFQILLCVIYIQDLSITIEFVSFAICLRYNRKMIRLLGQLVKHLSWFNHFSIPIQTRPPPPPPPFPGLNLCLKTNLSKALECVVSTNGQMQQVSSV